MRFEIGQLRGRLTWRDSYGVAVPTINSIRPARTVGGPIRRGFRIGSRESCRELLRLRLGAARAAYTRVSLRLFTKSDGEVARLRGASLVAVVQAADLRNARHAASRRRRDRTGKRCILVQAQMRSCSCVVGDVFVKDATKVGRRQHDHVIEALAPDRSNETFDVGVLPRRARRRQDFLSANRLQVIERMIPIAEDIPR